MAKGTIKKLVQDKGFGFITPERGGPDVFFHCSVLPRGAFELLTEGQRVEFESATVDGRVRATQLQAL